MQQLYTVLYSLNDVAEKQQIPATGKNLAL